MKDYPALSEFYDDLRIEVGGRFTFVGSYPKTAEQRTFPTPPGKFCVRNIVLCGEEDKPKEISFRLTLNGEELFETVQDISNVPSDQLPDSKNLVFYGMIVLEAFSFSQPGILESFVAVDGNDWQRSGWLRLTKKVD
ncbi:hypothetical protein AA0311_1515 [Asaia bogorensis NBRC 16594]|uniref:Uncharacterized protein n=1 Tax=Asaia bogorensis NBRC 16594 TaxID=1231624 RepID=A0AAN4R3J4_9PROT|nr:hypothetical protein Asbog_01521 [Asaia bogorensis NBRC 16594]GBQ77684.1 hypothetical protein AA0311_1515 [Asaia bogorensis NBRC 16594]GEL54366.1 hypothetical protein ABO01nite_23730 [Asaia bogorensis NBRC 16594]